MTATVPTDPSVALYDAHGSALFSCALWLLGDRAAAERATVETIAAAALDPGSPERDRGDLVERLHQWCAGRYAGLRSPGSQPRVALGLCRYGRRDYRWVARVMGTSPSTVAELLGPALRQLQEESPRPDGQRA